MKEAGYVRAVDDSVDAFRLRNGIKKVDNTAKVSESTKRFYFKYQIEKAGVEGKVTALQQ